MNDGTKLEQYDAGNAGARSIAEDSRGHAWGPPSADVRIADPAGHALSPRWPVG